MSVEGWARPLGATRAHYFERRRVLSLCAGSCHADEAARYPDDSWTPEAECEACRALVRELQAAGA